MMNTWISQHPQGCLIHLHVQPGASKSEFSGIHGGRLKIKIKAKPEKGEANEELIEFIADLIGISKSRVFLWKGGQSRQKDLLLEIDPVSVLKEITKLGL